MGQFTTQQWNQIFAILDGRQNAYGFPERRAGSLVFSSFNIRKLGALMSGNATKRSPGAWMLISQYCAQCDFLAVQEVMDDLTSLLHLKDQLGANYSLVISDTAGGIPGGAAVTMIASNGASSGQPR